MHNFFILHVKCFQAILNYEDASTSEYGYLLIDLKQTTPNDRRILPGILPNEMASLTLNSFIFKDSMMFLKIEGNSESKNREIPLPKEKLIRYYNKYIELRNPNAKSFFYNKDNKQIEVNLLSEIVKRLLEFCNVSARDKTPKMLRKTYALFLNNEKGKDGFTQPEQNIKYLLGLANTTQLREILKYGTIDVVTASCVFENLEI